MYGLPYVLADEEEGVLAELFVQSPLLFAELQLLHLSVRTEISDGRAGDFFVLRRVVEVTIFFSVATALPSMDVSSFRRYRSKPAIVLTDIYRALRAVCSMKYCWSTMLRVRKNWIL